MFPKYDSIISDLKERLAFEEEERADTPLSNREDRFYLDGKILAYRYALKVLSDIKDGHLEILKAIIEQFKSFKCRCSNCPKECESCGESALCEDNDLYCLEGLEESARELDDG